MERLSFELGAVLYAGAPVLLAFLLWHARRLRRQGLARVQIAGLCLTRGLGLLLALVFLARPVRPAPLATQDRRTVVLLLDRSRSMGLTEAGQSRYQQATGWAQDRLAPALRRAGFKIESLAFDASTTPLSLSAARAGQPTGSRTDLAGAIVQAAVSVDPAPAAIVALTDGAANRADSNQAALLSLLESATPFLAVGFGRDQGVPSLNLTRALAPQRVPPKQSFRVSAQLQASGSPLPDFDLLLLRDGALAKSRRVAMDGGGSRLWSEGFELSESEPGLHEYTLQLRLPAGSKVVTASTRSSVPVRIGQETEFRILFVQGALTWDFKFIGRALRSDPTVRMTGLSRTSKQSVFRQNLESAGELAGGFPRELAEIAAYRVLVLSELRAADLTPAQQDLVARFCSELGGGVLMIGGEASFDGSWQGSRLEQLLPVSFDTQGRVSGLDRPFRFQLTEEAKRSAVFQVTDDGSSSRAWDGLPSFTGYGRVRREKSGAVVWARHDQDNGPHGRRVLMASQSYGAGLAAVLSIESLWRWRLAKDGDPAAYDRFWRQLFHYLGQAGRAEFQIQILDQELSTGTEIKALLERLPRPEEATGAGNAGGDYRLRVRAPGGKTILDQTARLEPLRPVEIRFRAEAAGLYTVAVEDGAGTSLAAQAIEILDLDHEMTRTARDMENLRQWAAVSGGFALPAEEATEATSVVARIEGALAQSRGRSRPVPLGVNGWVLAALLALLGSEWLLRKRWGLP